MSAGPDIGGLQKELTAAKHPRERAAVVGKLLAALGDPLRCGQRCQDEVLGALARADVEGWLSVVDTEAVRAELSRAAEAALEAALAEGDAERAEWEGWALQALGSRDALDAALHALARWESAGAGLSEAGRRIRERLSSELARVDGQAPAIARRLVGINAARRMMRDRLAAEHRQRAWWYASRADCDPLVRLWTEPEVPPEETAHCLECARDRHNAKLAERPPGHCVSEDELWMLDSGELAPARRRLIERHALKCGECALALQAAAVPVEENPEGAPELARAAGPAPEVVASRPEFKVLLFRKPQARLVVEPLGAARLAAAALQLPAAAQLRGAPASPTVEIDLGKVKLGQRGRLSVTLAGGRTVDVDVAL